MNTTEIKYSNLQELSVSDYRLESGQANIKGWPVKSEEDHLLGTVRDLLFDPEAQAVRYVIIDLAESLTSVEDKAVLIPIGLVTLSDERKEVILPEFHHDQLEAMPRYIIGEVSEETEDEIRRVIGSPAALRLEEETVQIDRQNFYRHHHFGKNQFPLNKNQQGSSDL